MTFEEAFHRLNTYRRAESRDHAFGDCEVVWFDEANGNKVAAGGYFSGSDASVWFEDADEKGFDGDDARRLRECGRSVSISRNDETGPDTYSEGEVMPGLSKGDVFHELTGKYMDENKR